MDRKVKNGAQHQMYTEEIMRALGSGISDALGKTIGKDYGFTLLVFPFGREGISNYISNANRAEIISMLRETADRLEARQDMPPGALSIN